VSNILVNGSPGGPVDLILTETTKTKADPAPRTATQHYVLTKAPQAFFLDTIAAEPTEANYGGISQISWNASHN